MNYSKTALNRRAFLYAAGTAGVALPFLEGMPSRSAFAQTTQKAGFAFFICTAGGVQQGWKVNEPESFWPTTPGPLTTASMNEFAAERCTGMLADHAERLLIIQGIDHPAGLSGCGHAQGLVQCLTARPSSGGGNGATSTGPSIDTVLAETLNPAGVAPLATYSGLKLGFINEKLSFSAAGQVRSAESNPYNVYQRLTGLDSGTGEPNPMADHLAARRKSVNDLVRDQINDLKAKPQLSVADRDRLDLHFTSIRDIENDMQALALSCSEDSVDMDAIQAMNSGQAFKQNGVIEEVARLHMDLVGLTFACNANRVATLQVGDGTDATRYTLDGKLVENFHHISHRVNSDGPSGSAIANAVQMHAAIDRIRMETFKYLLDRWAQFDTPDGPLFDNGFAMWTSHISVGPSHNQENLPIIIAGNPGGFLKSGHYIEVNRVKNSLLFNTLATAVGVPMEDFGSGGTGLLPDMLA